MNWKSIRVLAACAGAFLAAPVLAEDLIVFEEDGGGAGPRGLYNVDSGSGTFTLRTTVGGSERLFSLAVQPSTGDVWGIDPLSDKMVKIDVDTGALTTVGFVSGVDTLADITFAPDGTMWGLERNFPTKVYTIDLGTLTTTVIGETDAARTGLTWLGNRLFAFGLTGTLYEIDTNTGADTLIGGGGYARLIEDATAGTDGMLYVTDFFGDFYKANPADGVGSFIGNTGNSTGLLGVIPVPVAGDCITLDNTGLFAGENTTWTISGATPGQKVVVVYGTQPGEIILNGFLGYCATIGIKGVNQNKTVGNPKNADANGEAEWTRQIPRNLQGARVLTQGVGRDTCPDDCQSNILDQIVG